MRGLYWFRNDLRLRDNEALSRMAGQCDELLCVFVIEERWLREQFQSRRLGAFRWQFIRQSLQDLQQQLAACRQRLVIRRGQAAQVLAELIQQHRIECVGTTSLPAWEEQQQLKHIRQAHPGIVWHYAENFMLFEREQLPFAVQELPGSFTPFRKRVEPIPLLKPVAAPQDIPPAPEAVSVALPEWLQHPAPVLADDAIRFQGGEAAAWQQLRYYLHESQQVSRYKLTRNGLDGWDFSSKLSPWLAQGCITPRQVMAELTDYEHRYGANESTYWLYFELLWREYFQWLQWRHGSRLYQLRGIRDVNPLLTFYPQSFMAWKHGNTEEPLVNAFMRQLMQTGWMSNRGRQIVASYLVNGLGVDWRFGAAWFEAQLIDYDPASNWGNWQYLAGVGTDPRGRRAFNLAKQGQQYDPEGAFVRRYCDE